MAGSRAEELERQRLIKFKKKQQSIDLLRDQNIVDGKDVSFAELDKRKAESAGKVPVGEQPKSGGTDAQKNAAVANLAAQGFGEATGGGRAGNQDTASGVAAGAAGGAATGFAVGGGPWGAAVGAVVGGAVGALKAKSSRKRAAAQAIADKEVALAGIAKNKGDMINQALSNMSLAFGATLRQNRFLGRF